MTPPDNTSTARPDRRSSPKLATGVILLALAGVGLFAADNILGSVWFRVHLSRAAAISSLAWAMLGLWYVRPPWWVNLVALLVFLLATFVDLFQLLVLPIWLMWVVFTLVPWWAAALLASSWLALMFFVYINRQLSTPRGAMAVVTLVMSIYFLGQAVTLEHSPPITITEIRAESRVYLLAKYGGILDPDFYRIYDCNSLGLQCLELHRFDEDYDHEELFEIDPETGMPQVVADGEVIYTVPEPEPPH